MTKNTDSTARGRRLAIFMAAVGLFWIFAFEIGDRYGLSQRTRALFDLIALAGFGYGLWLGLQLWRTRRDDED